MNRLLTNSLWDVMHQLDGFNFADGKDRYLKETEDGYSYKVNMAGIKKDNINIKINENLIDVWAEQDGHKYRSWAYIPKQADSSTGKAKYEDGLLTISFDKKEKHKTIELKIN